MRDNAALAANAHTIAADAAPLLSPVPSHRQSASATVASALHAAQMHYRELASDIKFTIAVHAPTARDLTSLVDADPSSGDQWQPPLARAILRDEIDLFSDGPQRVQALRTLVRHITNVQPKPSVSRDALLAHLIKKAIHTFAGQDTFQLSRWSRREIAREAALQTARTDLKAVYRTVLPLASEKAVGWLREVHLCAQLRLDTMLFMTPVSADGIWSMLLTLETAVSSVKLKNELLSDIVHALSNRMNHDGEHTTAEIFHRIVTQLSTLPAKHRVTLMKALIQKKQILPPLERDHILDALLPQAEALPLEYQQMTLPVRGQAMTAPTASLRVIEFADSVTPTKWLASLDRLIALVPTHTGDRAIALGSLAVKCIRHANDVAQSDGDPGRAEVFRHAFEKILTSIDTTVRAHQRFIPLRALRLITLPTSAYEQRIHLCAVRAAHATAEGPPEDTARTLVALFIAARGADARP